MLMTLRSRQVRSQVQFDHDTAWALQVVVDLVNSDDPRTGVDALATAGALAAFLTDHAITGSRAGTDAELRAVHRLRRRLRGVFERADDGDRYGVVAALNGLIEAMGPAPRLVEHDGLPLHLHYTPADAPLDRRLGAEMSVALAIAVRDGGAGRLRVCESPDCGRVLVDLSKNHSRRYCDAQCANRQHVAAYRRRRRAGV
jgi:predicted RNA-binding Zn ribbon-like protein